MLGWRKRKFPQSWSPPNNIIPIYFIQSISSAMVKILVGVVILSCFLQMGVTFVLAAPVVGKQSKAANVVAAGGSSANSRRCSRAALKVAKVPKGMKNNCMLLCLEIDDG